MLLFTLLVLYNLSPLLYNSLFAINSHKYLIHTAVLCLSRGFSSPEATASIISPPAFFDSVSLLSLVWLDVATEMNK